MSRIRGPSLLIALVHLLSLAAAGAEQETAARPLPTSRQWKILAALDETTEVDFANVPLADVVDYLTQKHAIEIQLDNKALTDAGVGSDTPITRTIKDVKLHSLLRLLLRDLDLTTIVGDGYLLITSKTEAENKLRVQVYPVEDLVTLDSPFRAAPTADDKSGEDFQSLIALITNTVAPTTWDEVGGPGSITEYRNLHAIAVSQTDEAHDELVELLSALRAARDKQVVIAKPLDPKQQPATSDAPLQFKIYRLAGSQDQPVEPAAKGAEAPKPPAAAAVADDKSPAETRGPADASSTETMAADNKLDAWAKAIAKLAPELIEPDSWQPTGEGMARAVGETVVVRQTAEIQHRIGKLINEMLPGTVPASLLAYFPPVRLSLPPVDVKWPHEAEPLRRQVEARIEQALEEPCELNFTEQPLVDVMGKLREAHAIQICIDQKALTDAGVGTDTPMTRTIRGVRLRTALKLLLEEFDLTYLIRNEVLMITTKTEAENMLTTKVYPIFDLVVRPPDAPPSRPALDFQSLIANVTSNIAPTTWDDVGGPGRIQGFTNAGAVVISQTTEVHEEIAEYLKALREVGAVQKK